MRPAPQTLEAQLRRSVFHVQQKKAKSLQMTNAIQLVDTGKLAAQVVIQGDLSGLNDAQLANYYVQLCNSLDLNHLTKPFTLLKLNGKLIYYANKDCSDQLRKRDKVSVKIVGRETVGDLLVVTAEAALPDGRVDQSIGALPIGNLKGEALANAMMKCETKAKRRVTLSICGLGFMDESEVEGAQDAENTGGSHSPHGSPDEKPAWVDPVVYQRGINMLLECEKDVFNPGITWERMNYWRETLGIKGDATRTELAKSLADLYRGDLTEGDRSALAKLWNRVDRKLAGLSKSMKPPPVESSFVDEPDGTEAFGAERQPGEDDDL